ncbi:MAG: ATP-binding protein [Deltaproteobacteria bacterium]|nr:MAG: ATP-binding protein [Deltaproteobacteria bacterium]
MHRYLEHSIQSDLPSKLVLISGPRQAGKTTIARQIATEISGKKEVYLNWDYPEHRRAIRSLDWPRSAPVVVLDEIHKFPGWKSLLKGFFDVEGHKQSILVTGSARLDVYRKGGDSLFGRAYHYRLHPLTLGEISRGGSPPDIKKLLDPSSWISESDVIGEETLKKLMTLGGFPEPYLKANERDAKRWRLNRRERVLHEDLRDLTLIRSIAKLENLLDLLLERVGSPISINALREDLEVDHKTVESWIEILERLHFVFQVRPYGKRIQRSISKARKIYFWDWSEVPETGMRLENLLGTHLLKLCHYLQDVEGIQAELRYVRDRNKREVDFLLLKERSPWVLVEAKTSDIKESKSLPYFAERLQVKHAFQVTLKRYRGRHIVPCWDFLSKLP